MSDADFILPVPKHALVRRGLTLLRVAAVVDAGSVNAAPGALLVEDGRVRAAGRPETIGQPASATVVEWPDALLMPGLVNAHAHLDLSHLPPVAFDGNFAGWIDSVRRGRHVEEESIAASVAEGARLARAGGTAFVGDIAGAGHAAAVTALRRSGLAGVSYLELFGVGVRQAPAISRIRDLAEELEIETGGVRLGLQPHAPYSCGPGLYAAAAESGWPVSTHLAETPEEIEVLAHGRGPLRAFLNRLGVWDPAIGEVGTHPIEAVLEWMAGTPFVAAHVNYARPDHLGELAAAGVTVAYCPRASAYFEHPRKGDPPHAYQSMQEAGVNVALGTDGRPCLDTADRISVLDEMRCLWRRDGVDPRRLLAMATVAGARGLGLPVDRVTLAPRDGCGGGVLRLTVDPTDDRDPLAQVLRGSDAPRWALPPGPGAGIARTTAGDDRA